MLGLASSFLPASSEQSSEEFGGRAAFAIDGGPADKLAAGYFNKKTCTHTVESSAPWWSVQLPSVTHIFAVHITNRVDCCGDRLNWLTIRVDGRVCEQNVHFVLGETLAIPCNGTGREVRIELPGDHRTLTLCEVEIEQQS